MKNYHILVAAAFSLAFGSCSEATYDEPELNSVTYTMEFDSPRPCWDDETGSRADATTAWQAGDEIYMRLNGESSAYAMAKAIYNGSNWTVTLTYNQTTKLKDQGTTNITYLEGYHSITSETLLQYYVNSNTTIYSAKSAIYTFDGSTIKLYGTLTPQCSGFRLKGTAEDIGKIIMVKSIDAYGIYYPIDNRFSTYKRPIYARTMHDDGQGGSVSDYVYATEWESKDIELLMVDDMTAYKTTITAPTFGVNGNRGYINLPTLSNHDGWDVGTSTGIKTCASNYSYGSSSYNAPSYAYDAVYKITLSLFNDMGQAYSITLKNDTPDPSEVLVELSNTDGKHHYVGETWYVPVSCSNNSFRPGVYNWLNISQTGTVEFQFNVELISFTDEVDYSGPAIPTPTVTLNSATCEGAKGQYGYSATYTMEATIEDSGFPVQEAGFLYRSDGYALDYTSNYNGNTQKIVCDAVDGKINYSFDLSSATQSTNYIYLRAYAVSSNGEVEYSGDKVYISPDMQYPR